MKEKLLSKSREALGWNRLLNRLSAFAFSEIGRELCKSLMPENEEEKVCLLQLETQEMVEIFGGNEDFPLAPFRNLEKVIRGTDKGVVLDLKSVAEIGGFIGICCRVKSYLKREGESYPQLFRHYDSLPDLSTLKKEIERHIDVKGEIREDATPKLKKLYVNLRNIRKTISKKINKYLDTSDYERAIQDNYHTIRDGRSVIPVKAEMRSLVNGIVHDSSSSGLTLFIEPQEMVEPNNELRIIEMEIQQEIHHIMVELTTKVSESGFGLLMGLESVGYLDLVYAKAKLAVSLKATRPALNREGEVFIKKGRHPFLVLDNKDVVANDIQIGGNVKILVISGPNTGGKTVTLKTLGLLSLMFQAGLPIPADPGSALPLIPEIYVDIGDEQDISGNLSSFSGHVTNIIGILNNASNGSLVLLDEIMTSTDPSEGGVLAEAVLIELEKKGVLVLITTHYSYLKTAAAAHDGFDNASVEFDFKSLAPTYKLINNLPGSSSAITIASRLGMDDKIIQSARGLLGHEERRMEEMFLHLDTERKRLEADRLTAVKLKQESERLVKESQETAERLKAEERDYLTKKKRLLSGEILAAKKEIWAVVTELKKREKAARTRGGLPHERSELVRKTRNRLQKLEEAIPSVPDQGNYVPLAKLKQGDRVVVPSLGLKGTLSEDPKGKKRVRINTGGAEVIAEAKSVRGIAGPGSKKENKKVIIESSPQSLDSEEMLKCHLLGYRVEEALDELTRFLDSAMLNNVNRVCIIHGHGTGVLKKEIREYLKSSPYVRSFRPGEKYEGGEGVTIVNLK